MEQDGRKVRYLGKGTSWYLGIKSAHTASWEWRESGGVRNAQNKLTSYKAVIIPARGYNRHAHEPAYRHMGRTLQSVGPKPGKRRPQNSSGFKKKSQQKQSGFKVIFCLPSLFIKLTDSQGPLFFSGSVYHKPMLGLEETRHLWVRVLWWLIIVVGCLKACLRDRSQEGDVMTSPW